LQIKTPPRRDVGRAGKEYHLHLPVMP
jgi:hypothetical protein